MKRFCNLEDCAIIDLQYKLYDFGDNSYIKKLCLKLFVSDLMNNTKNKTKISLIFQNVSNLKVTDDGFGRFGYIGGAKYKKTDLGFFLDFDPLDIFNEDTDSFDYKFNDKSNFCVEFENYTYDMIE